MDQDHTLQVGTYWSEVLCCTITTHLGDLEVKVRDFEVLVLVFISIDLLNIPIDG